MVRKDLKNFMKEEKSSSG